MKFNFYLAVMLLFASVPASADKARILEQKKGQITFVVDENLPKPQDNYMKGISQAARLKGLGSSTYYSLDNSYIAASFWDTPMMNDDAPFFTGMVRAFADHRPVSLSPDVIWMLISQAFSHEVNADPEKFRDKFVDFDGKTDLIVQTQYRLYDPDFDWTATIDGFARKIEANTKGDIAKLLTANYSTTGTVERMASEIVLMETTKSFFEFIVMYLGCGIPSVTLTGTADDWQAVMDKTARLRKLGAGSWASELKPILEQFVQAVQGNPDQEFWQDIVMKKTPSSLRGGGCSFEEPTLLDGWFLKLMPFDKDGKPTPAKVPHTSRNFARQMASVPVKYIEVDSLSGQVNRTIPLKLSGGIAGYMTDDNDCVSFHIGWAVNLSDEYENIQRLEKEAPYDIKLRVSKVPEELRAVRHYNRLELQFTDKVEVPAWMDSLEIERLVIHGSLSLDEQSELKKRFGKRVQFEIVDTRNNTVKVPLDTPLIVLDGNIAKTDFIKLIVFDFEKDIESRDKMAELLDMKSRQIKGYRTLEPPASTAIWGAKGMNGLIEVMSTEMYNSYLKDSKAGADMINSFKLYK